MQLRNKEYTICVARKVLTITCHRWSQRRLISGISPLAARLASILYEIIMKTMQTGNGGKLLPLSGY